ncbi:PepSY domain-containing protein [Streptomyces sp. NPDC052309]|nr:PepSY domain-containing protein [Streptomyces griseicoloratus]
MAVICALGGSLLLTACSNADTARSSVAEAAQTESPTGSPTGTASPSPTQPLTEDQAERKALIPMAKVTWDKAADAAVKEVPDGKLVHLELKRFSTESTESPGTPSPSTPAPAPSQDAPEWEAKVASADGTVHRIDVDAVTGEVFRTQIEPDQDADDKREVADRLSQAEQTPEQAVKVATDKTKGTVTSVELDENDDRQLLWSVDVVNTDDWNKTTYDIDAKNGKILREHVDRD